MYRVKTFFLLIVITSSTLSVVSAENDLENLQNRFNNIARSVSPSVVSVSSVVMTQDQEGEVGLQIFEDFIRGIYGLENVAKGEFENYLKNRMGVGSGMIVHRNGYILTNYHIVKDVIDGRVSVKLQNHSEYTGTIIGVDSQKDIALIKINETGLPAVKLASRESIKVGDWAVAIGNPYGFVFDDAQPSVTVGVISALNRSLPISFLGKRPFKNLIQTDAAINLGNSGGPLVNLKGEVVGMNTAIVSTTGGNQGIGFAIPSSSFQNLLDHFIEGRHLEESWLGIQAQNLSEDLAKYFNIDKDKGVLIIETIEGSPAHQAGLKGGDVLIRFDEIKVNDLDKLYEIVEASDVGKLIKVEFYRGRDLRVANIRVGTRPMSYQEFRKNSRILWRGIQPEKINDVLKKRYQLSIDEGVVLVNLEPGSLGDMSGLIEGDLITGVNHHRVNSLGDFYMAIEEYEAQDVLIKTPRGYFVVKAN